MDHRLAAIVAVDIAGYSSRAEADEGAAVRAVAALSGLIDQIAQDHAGRVFNTAGDGFMLEFPTASGALAAAKDLAAEADIPIRVGVHLGEVYATTSGDLLGHGVNVAARLQALAKPGSIMVSDDVRRAVRGALVQGLVSQGRHRLDKMKETAEVFSLSAAPPARKTIWPAWAAGKAGLKVGGAAALALLLLAAAAFGVSAFRPGSRMPPNLTTAVRDFTVRGAGLDPQFGRSLADGVAAALGERQAPTVSRDLARRGDFGGARLLVGGEVEQVGQNLREHIHIDDGQAGLILWAGDLQRPVDQADGLRDETAAKVTDIIDRLRTQIGPEAAALKPEAMAAVMKALEIERLGVNRVNRAREAWTRVVELAPNFSRGHSSLAFADLYSNDAMTPQQVQMRREDARKQIKTALALDHHSGEPYLLSALLEKEDDLVAQDSWIVRGLAVDPDHDALNGMEGNLLAGVGLLTQSLGFHQRALAADPLSPSKTLGVIFSLIQTNRLPEARALADHVANVWPDYPTLPVALHTMNWIYGDPAKAREALDAEAAHGGPMSDQAVAAWRQVLDARAGKLAPATAARALAQAAREDPQIDLGLEESALAQLGQKDLAFQELDRRLFTERAHFYTSTLFSAANANLWNDPRFPVLTARLGIARYWQATGRWPDLCRQPAPPAFCRAAAHA